MNTGIRGHVIDAPEFGSLRSYEDGAVIFDSKTGSITSVGTYQDNLKLAGSTRELPVP